jgi:hypothetical protein
MVLAGGIVMVKMGSHICEECFRKVAPCEEFTAGALFGTRTCEVCGKATDARTCHHVCMTVERVRERIAAMALWENAREAMIENGHDPGGVSVEMLRLAKVGHRNAIPIVAGLLEDVTGCPTCGDECCIDDTPGRAREREALKALHDTIASILSTPSLPE